MKCEYCEMLERSDKAGIIYEDNDLVVAVKDLVFSPGQITVFPRNHYTILEQVPNKILGRCVEIANKVSISIFETLGSQGTNLMIRNGLGSGQNVPHFCLEIIPRQENDKLGLQWEPKQLMEDEIETTFLVLEEAARNLILEEKLEKKELPKVEKTEVKEGKENYLLKTLRRIP